MIDASATDAAFAVTYPTKRVLVFGDTQAARWAGTDAVERLGAGLAGALPLEDAMEKLACGHTAAVVLLEAREAAPDLLEPVLDRLESDARRGRPSIVVVPPSLLDLALARAGHRSVTLLCDPDPLERTAALGLALADPTARLNDISTEQGASRLRQLSEEVGRIARTLASLSSESTMRPGLRASSPLLEGLMPTATPAAREIEAPMVRAIIRARRMRDQFFDKELFADPAWDILLDLTAARLERTPVAVSSLCIAAAVPPTTALRWIKTLTDAGLLVRAADTKDGRRVFIELSAQAAAGMTAYLQALGRLSALFA